MYSLSTCWNSTRHTEGREMLREIRDLGFEYAELSHGIRMSLVPGILEAVAAGEIKISSLHNFCPLPMGINYAAPNVFKFSSDDPRERENARKHTLKTIEMAERVGAGLIVLHTGAVELRGFWGSIDYNEKLEAMLEAGQKDSPKYAKLVSEMLGRREKPKDRAMEHAADIIRQVAEVAGAKGILLGIENREAVEEIPFDDEIGFFLGDLPENVRYWHDTGHAQIKENLGLIVQHSMHVESLADRLAGFHVHDVKPPGMDHCPPGSGMIDFAALAPFVKPTHRKVLELNPGVSPDDVRTGFEFVRKVWGPE
ncbi:MAG: sugar phosphate isomerase/epimerase [Verrucomicrobia bacterium]|nr:MAG: sugar phosphate isomerase/epimerase [Verrucomicrobiota bacterium]